jgi:hypothetical protein
MKGKHLAATIGLLFLFGACEKDIVGGFGDGKKVEIFLSTNITNYHTGADVTRSGGLREAESTTMYINDSIYLQTTVVPDDDDELRTNASFIDGQKLCFAAFLTDGTPKGSEIYTYSDAAHKWIPDGDPLGVVPDNSTTYRFVAYSYFGEAGATLSTTGIDPVHDLVWGMSGNMKIEDETEAKRTVIIHMNHKFARVKVNVNSEGISGADIEALSGVSIEGGQLAELTPFDGGISWSGTATQGVADPFTVKSEKERESGYRTVKPVAAGALKVKVGSVKISTTATTFTNSMVSFTPALSNATSYTLVVTVKKCVWARSNIYWHSTGGNNGYLTFVPVGNDLSKQGYQGVFFKFGSLVGVSPAQTGGVNAFSTSTVVYIPTYNKTTYTSSSWTKTDSHSYTAAGWPFTLADATETNAENIPYLDGRAAYNASGNTGRDSDFVMHPDQNTDEMYEGRRGDICQYLSKTGAVSGNYRLPTSLEFGTTNGQWAASNPTSTPNAYGWIKGIDPWTSANNAAGYADGTADLLDNTAGKNGGNTVYGSAKNRPMGDVVFPASGMRDGSFGALYSVGNLGMYWSGSSSYSMQISNNYGVHPGIDTGRSYGFSVRCVQKLD